MGIAMEKFKLDDQIDRIKRMISDIELIKSRTNDPLIVIECDQFLKKINDGIAKNLHLLRE